MPRTARIWRPSACCLPIPSLRRPPLDRTGNTFPVLGTNWPALIYLGIGITQALLYFARAFIWTKCSIASARIVHDDLMRSLMHAPISFFDSTPVCALACHGEEGSGRLGEGRGGGVDEPWFCADPRRRRHSNRASTFRKQTSVGRYS